jgi:pyridoxal phosphate enzyme (YggS family)
MSIETNINEVITKVKQLSRKNFDNRLNVKILAVSKKKSREDIVKAYKAGLSDFGENYIDEGLEKIKFFKNLDLGINWHFIGSIQSNKTRQIAENFDWVHSVDSLKVVKRLGMQRPEHMKPLNILLQLNLGREDSKSGVQPDELNPIIYEIEKYKNLSFRGLMTIPENYKEPKVVKFRFLSLSEVQSKLIASLPPHYVDSVDSISMGMSNDFDLAIEASNPRFQTIIRIGTSIFGQRT